MNLTIAHFSECGAESGEVLLLNQEGSAKAVKKEANANQQIKIQ